ncbi:MAG: peptide ABC transporter substrate-binding protein [Acidobacteria bacterium]|nr:peptide ABC transporter substrate-binding protein [Acidobacteriota bacterium]
MRRFFAHPKISFLGLGLMAAAVLFGASCSEVRQPPAKEYFANTPPPQKQEFRWSNGRSPKTLDPARAAAAPETDIVRAIYEGLTELDPRSLEEMPAVAESWTVSNDLRVWTFRIRSDAKWSNGSPLVAEDFARSWRRVLSLGKEAPHRELMANIAGAKTGDNETHTAESGRATLPAMNALSAEHPLSPSAETPSESEPPLQNENDRKFGVEAPDERTLVVKLIEPDKDFARLVAHSVFRPVFDGGKGLSGSSVSSETVVNGAFSIADVKPEGLTIERSDHYWNREEVRLERVVFVPTESGDKALEAYRKGEVDAVTNTEFSPLALKLLTPYADFRRTTFAAINFYEINYDLPVFRDRRVREALALAIERERLTEGELEGTTQPAMTFLPFGSPSNAGITQDRERAKDLMEAAGYEEGRGFPVIRLTVNRNDTQIRIARSVAGMWKRNLNIETDIQIKESSEIETLRKNRDFEMIRRGVVLRTPDEMIGLRSIFGSAYTPLPPEPGNEADVETTPDGGPNANSANTIEQPFLGPVGPIADEGDAIFELTAIPLYFPLSYALVKPFVTGFDSNSLDHPLLHRVAIDAEWRSSQPAATP